MSAKFLRGRSRTFFRSKSKESKMRNLIFVKYNITQTELLFAQPLQSICSVFVDTSKVILLVTFSLSYSLTYESKHGNH